MRQIRSATQVAIFLQISACLWFATAGCSVSAVDGMKCSQYTWMEKRLIEEQHSDGGGEHGGNHSVLFSLDVHKILGDNLMDSFLTIVYAALV